MENVFEIFIKIEWFCNFYIGIIFLINFFRDSWYGLYLINLIDFLEFWLGNFWILVCFVLKFWNLFECWKSVYGFLDLKVYFM